MASAEDKAIGVGNLRELAKEAERVAAEYRLKAAHIERELEEARRPRMPEVVAGEPCPVVTFSKYQSGREYHYAALGWRLGRSVRWAVTGQTTDRMNWPGLLAFIGEGNWHSLVLLKLDGAEHLLLEGNEPPVAEKMGRFGQVISSEVPGYGRAQFARGGMVPTLDPSTTENAGWPGPGSGY